jgi:glycosyltransferase involved in cell wall biosynthesis
MIVTYFQRRPQGGQFSIERVFDAVRKKLPSDVNCRVATSTFSSRGLFRRIYNMIEALFRQGDVNHVTGDIHFLAIVLSPRKTLLTIHDCVSLHRLKGLRRNLFRLLWYTLPIRRARLVTVISESTKAEVIKLIGCNPSKLRVVPDCISELLQKSPAEFNERRPLLLQVGTTPNKNVSRLIQAIRGLPCRLHIVGSLHETLEKELAKSLVDYRVSKNLSDVEILSAYQECDMLVFASTYEGFGLPVIEANAVGRPVITSNLAPMTEVADGAACLVDPFSVLSIREGVVRVIGDKAYRNSLIELGYNNAERFRAEKIAHQYAQLYREIAAT